MLPFGFALKCVKENFMKTINMAPLFDRISIQTGRFVISLSLSLLGVFVFLGILLALGDLGFISIKSPKGLFETVFLFVVVIQTFQKIFEKELFLATSYFILTMLTTAAFLG